MDQRENVPAQSRMSLPETAGVLVWLPIHVLLLPLLLARYVGIRGADLNLWVYLIGTAALMLLCGRFLRRDFETLCARPLAVAVQVPVCYGMMMLGNLLVSLAVAGLEKENPNNAALLDLAAVSSGKIAAMTVILAPILEELIFRGGVFGLLRRKNRYLAYAGCILLFAVYHTWQYALADPIYWLYILQYLPAGWALCRCYEKTETIWAPIFLHMITNGVSLWALNLLREMSR